MSGWSILSIESIEKAKGPSYFLFELYKPFCEYVEDQARLESRCAPSIMHKQYEGVTKKILDHQTLGQRKNNRQIKF